MSKGVNLYKTETVNKIASLIIGVLFFLTLFMPYLKASAMGFSESITFRDYMQSDGEDLFPIFLIITLAVVLIYIILQFTGHPRLSIIGAIGMFLLTLFWSVACEIEKMAADPVNVNAQIGFWVCWICTIAAFVFVFIKPLGNKQ